MRVLALENYHEDLDVAVQNLRVAQKPTPTPGPGQVLVQIETAPCNPSDLIFMQGLYGVVKALPAVPGWEGSGTVVASGGGIIANWLKGKRVACGGQAESDGTWAEYYLADVKNCVPLRNNISFEQGASLIVNPLTAWALIEEAQKGRHGGIVQTAAASQLGRMILRLADEAGIPLINIVRRKEQEEILKSLGAEIVLNAASKDFAAQLQNECHRLNTTICFDAVAGEMTGIVLNAMPKSSKVIVYGVLSHSPAGGIDGRELIFGQKRVYGFWLTSWIRNAGIFKIYKAFGQIQKRIAAGSLATQVRQYLKLEEVPGGLIKYQRQMTSGKILIVPNQE
jgi:NADPH:quinone reductase-like Zn-dependent oxidoreductase